MIELKNPRQITGQEQIRKYTEKAQLITPAWKAWLTIRPTKPECKNQPTDHTTKGLEQKVKTLVTKREEQFPLGQPLPEPQ